jgi:hypothetical protein
MEVVKPMAKVFADGGRDGEREREERGSAGSRKEGGRLVFLLILDPKISSSGP